MLDRGRVIQYSNYGNDFHNVKKHVPSKRKLIDNSVERRFLFNVINGASDGTSDETESE